eukprot:5492856-Alexandrium_andersonii.AAC.1
MTGGGSRGAAAPGRRTRAPRTGAAHFAGQALTRKVRWASLGSLESLPHRPSSGFGAAGHADGKKRLAQVLARLGNAWRNA